MAYEKKEKMQSYISVFKTKKCPIRPNNILHLKMLSHLYNEENKINMDKYSVLRNLVI